MHSILNPALRLEHAVPMVGGVSLSETRWTPTRTPEQMDRGAVWAGSIAPAQSVMAGVLGGSHIGEEQPLLPTLGAYLRTRWWSPRQPDLGIATGVCLIRKFSARKNHKVDGRNEHLAPHRGLQSQLLGPARSLSPSLLEGLARRFCVSCRHCDTSSFVFQRASVTHGDVS